MQVVYFFKDGEMAEWYNWKQSPKSMVTSDHIEDWVTKVMPWRPRPTDPTAGMSSEDIKKVREKMAHDEREKAKKIEEKMKKAREKAHEKKEEERRLAESTLLV